MAILALIALVDFSHAGPAVRPRPARQIEAGMSVCFFCSEDPMLRWRADDCTVLFSISKFWAAPSACLWRRRRLTSALALHRALMMPAVAACLSSLKPRSACSDSDDFRDSKGFNCRGWRGYSCNECQSGSGFWGPPASRPSSACLNVFDVPRVFGSVRFVALAVRLAPLARGRCANGCNAPAFPPRGPAFESCRPGLLERRDGRHPQWLPVHLQQYGYSTRLITRQPLSVPPLCPPAPFPGWPRCAHFRTCCCMHVWKAFLIIASKLPSFSPMHACVVLGRLQAVLTPSPSPSLPRTPPLTCAWAARGRAARTRSEWTC